MQVGVGEKEEPAKLPRTGSSLYHQCSWYRNPEHKLVVGHKSQESTYNPEGDHNANFDSKLLHADQQTANLGRSTFSNIHGYNHAQTANAHSDDESTCKDAIVTGVDSRTLDDYSEDEDACIDDDTIFSRDDFG